MIRPSLSLNNNVKLKTVDRPIAYIPPYFRLMSDTEKSMDDQQSEELYNTVRGILNKLTPQRFDTLMKKFMILPINSEDRLTKVISLIFDKAIHEPKYSKVYANMCKLCSKLEVVKMENGQEQKVNFGKILITRCQTEFESNKSAELDSGKWLEEIKNCNNPEDKKELQLIFEEKKRELQKKSVGNIRFAGELFKLGMLTSSIMYRLIEDLLESSEDESLEGLCVLLTTIGKDLESGTNSRTPPASLDLYYQKMNELGRKKEDSKVSSKVRFMLQDVIDLRSNRWVAKREDNNPKTIEQINKEAERESIEMTIVISQPPPRMNRQNERQDNEIGRNRGDDGWSINAGSFQRIIRQTPKERIMKDFEAMSDINLVKPCANLCKVCSELEVVKMENGQELKVNFGEILMTRCQEELERNLYAALDFEIQLVKIRNDSFPTLNPYLQKMYELTQEKERSKSWEKVRLMLQDVISLYKWVPRTEDNNLEQINNKDDRE